MTDFDAIEHDVLSQFHEASADLSMHRSLLQRVDWKFVLPRARLAELLSELRGDYAVLPAGNRRSARYLTLYFDTPSLVLFFDHRLERPGRCKVRIRHYPDREVSFLEVKQKRGETRTHKRRRERGYGSNALSASDRDFIASSGLPAWDLVPQVWTNFSRITLAGLHTEERVTIDIDVELRVGERHASLGLLSIVEVKQARPFPMTPALRVLRDAGVRPCRASKYVTAMSLLRRDVPHREARDHA